MILSLPATIRDIISLPTVLSAVLETMSQYRTDISADTLHEESGLESIFHKLWRWTESTDLKFNEDKWKMLRWGKRNPMAQI